MVSSEIFQMASLSVNRTARKLRLRVSLRASRSGGRLLQTFGI
jgi:hypothetical protein